MIRPERESTLNPTPLRVDSSKAGRSFVPGNDNAAATTLRRRTGRVDERDDRRAGVARIAVDRTVLCRLADRRPDRDRTDCPPSA